MEQRSTERKVIPYRALSRLENECAPTLNRRAPFWRPTPAKPWREIHTPAWSWTHPAYEGQDLVLTDLDVNGAFLAAASSANFAHGALEHTGPLSLDRRILPGYYLIEAHPWQDTNIVSPLGSGNITGRIWVTGPTIELLRQLVESGHWPDLTIFDSWTCAKMCRFRDWTGAVGHDRAEAISRLEAAKAFGTEDDQEAAQAAYDAIKTGYSMAVQMMLGPTENSGPKSAVKRPDWYHTIHGQYAASIWRSVWKVRQAGFIPVMMGSVDTVTYMSCDVETFNHPNRPGGPLLKMDETGVQLGAFKTKAVYPAGS